jgi:hypothetical protein
LLLLLLSSSSINIMMNMWVDGCRNIQFDQCICLRNMIGDLKIEH